MPIVAPRWDTLASDTVAADRLAAELGITPVVARLLCQRGLGDPEQASRFLNPSIEHLNDPMALADMGKAVDRIGAFPVVFGRQPSKRFSRPAPRLGEHNREVLGDLLGVDDAELARLTAQKIIGTRPGG